MCLRHEETVTRQPVGVLIKVSAMGNIKRILMGLATATLALSTTACTSTTVTKTVYAAPITYKVGDGATKYASLTTPQTSISQPSYDNSYIPAVPTMPAPVPTPAPQQMPQAVQQFDQVSVDPDLYKHQRVGKTYKIMGKSYTPKHDPSYDVTGVASWYGDKFHGKPTATGETYDMNDLTAAHKTLPLNSMLFVTNVENGKTLMVRLNDRGPFVGDRIIDLSSASAKALGITGLGQVRVQYAGPADPMAANRAPVTAPVEVARPVEEYVQAPSYTPPPIPQPIPAPIATPAPAPAPAPYVPAAPVRPTAPSTIGNSNAQPDGQVTLTIKGPIHVAKYNGEQAELIRQRLKTK